ncbi:hypothetical protein Btru_032094 [Bulinus truncatus]|nr:hypothetical protein Btru_032094 [Bulinus truncatus]
MFMSSKQLKQWFLLTIVLVLVLTFLAGIYIPKAVSITWPLIAHKLWLPSQGMLKKFSKNDHTQFSNREISTNKMESVIDRLMWRARRLKKTCQNQMSVSDDAKSKRLPILRDRPLFVNKRHRLIYWAIPKVGSSFWKRIFKVLDSSSMNGGKMFDMTNMEAHINVPQSMVFSNYHQSAREEMLRSYTKFLFVREPFSRLFSAYVDKLMIPADVGETVTKQMISSGALLNRTCPWQVSFTELCSYVADTILGHKKLEDHFSPVSVHQPCGFNVTMLGKVETFQEDFRAILYSSNISLVDVAGDVPDVEIENEIGYIKDISFRTMRFLVSSKIFFCILHTM